MPNILYFGDVMRDILFNAKIVMKLDTKSLHFFYLNFRESLVSRKSISLMLTDLFLREISQVCWCF